MMKKIIALLLSATMTLSMTACGGKANDTQQASEETPKQEAPSFDSTEEIINAIYEIKPMELNMGNMAVDLNDEYALQSYLGLTPDITRFFILSPLNKLTPCDILRRCIRIPG